ncbi:hypothetical protein [Salininema proteolyticum]|uniref:Uncharacterized protein n=1 Tax=Salininema proteolyticum TaxID=1607685 RepID=A0ABV8U051_9ACTN
MNDTLNPPPEARARSIRSWHLPLLVNACLMTGLAVFSAVAVFIDDRTLLGESVWVKPLKFGVAFAAYAATLAWLYGRLTKWRRTAWWTGSVFAVVGVVEVGVIAFAAALGTYSHFNQSDDPANRFVQETFQYGVPGIFMTGMLLAILVLTQRMGDKAQTNALRWGLGLSVLGMASAYLIVSVSAEFDERTVLDAGGNEVPLSGSHGVGDPDGGGMFLTGWSTTGGDMRVAHFVGLHGIQVMILAAVAIAYLSRKTRLFRVESVRNGIVHSLALGYLGVFATLVWQAMEGEAFVDPSAGTIAALTVSGAVAVLGSLIAVARGQAVLKKEEPLPELIS